MQKAFKIIISIILSLAIIYPLWKFASNAVISSYLIRQVGTLEGDPSQNSLLSTVSGNVSTNTLPQAGQSKEDAQIKMTAQNVSAHNRADDCWLIINNRVYDVTNFISIHPGGAGRITAYCGKEATSAYATRGGNGTHSSSANNLLAGYFIAGIGQEIRSAVPAIPSGSPKPAGSKAIPVTTKPAQAPASGQTFSVQNINLTMVEVAKHNVTSNCWMVISNSVYDLTTFIPSHPGGSSMIPFCGKDGTQAFATKGGGGGNHSSNASGLLANYLLGTLGSTASIKTTDVGTAAHPAAPSGTLITGENEYEDEYEYEDEDEQEYEYEY